MKLEKDIQPANRGNHRWENVVVMPCDLGFREILTLGIIKSKNQFVDSWVEKAAWVCRLHMAFYLTNHQYIVLLHIHNHVLRLVGYLETHPGSAIRIIQNSLSRIFPLDSPIRLESSMSRFDKNSQQCLICEACGNFGLFDPLATFRRRWHDLMC